LQVTNHVDWATNHAAAENPWLANTVLEVLVDATLRSEHECQRICRETQGCDFFSYEKETGADQTVGKPGQYYHECYLKASYADTACAPAYCPWTTGQKDGVSASGPSTCPRTDAAAPTGCRVSIVGAGPGGVYTAWRLAKDGFAATGIAPAAVCLFERTERLGGRIFSVRHLGAERDLVVESGAYRFSSDGATPLLTAVINEALGLPHVEYDNSHYKIVTDASDPDSNAGYVR
jgi:hypothetical protein